MVSVLLPQGEGVASFRLEGGIEAEAVAGRSRWQRSPGRRWMTGRCGASDPQPGQLPAKTCRPGEGVRHLGTSGWKGYTIATFEVFPVRYDISTGRLTAVEGMTLVVDTAPAKPGRQAMRQRHIDGFRDASRRMVRGSVANPQEASAAPARISWSRSSRAFMPSYMPGVEGSEVRYLIVTNEEMEAEFQRLADWKTKKGVPAVAHVASNEFEQKMMLGSPARR